MKGEPQLFMYHQGKEAKGTVACPLPISGGGRRCAGAG
jgi:hypothetical protein